MSDFEPVLLNVIKAEVSALYFLLVKYMFFLQFSTSIHLSCYFHFTQAMYRNIQRLGVSSTYNNDDYVKHLCRKLMALVLLPEPVIEDTYDELVKNLSTEMKKTMCDLLEYFQEQWFAKVPTTQWCVHGLSMRTNNNADGKYFILFLTSFHTLMFILAFHSRFNRRAQIHHPNIWSFIKFLQGEETRFHHMYTQFTAGLGARTKQAKTIAIQRRIDN
jgi:hypothetical protein